MLIVTLTLILTKLYFSLGVKCNLDLLEVSITCYVGGGRLLVSSNPYLLALPSQGREVRAAFDLKVEATRHVV